MDQVEQLSAAIAGIGAKVEGYREKQGELHSRIFELEQKAAAKGLFNGTSRASTGGPSVGAMAEQEFSESHGFASLKEWNHGTVRASLKPSVRAIVNDGHQPDGGGSMPSAPERGGVAGPVSAPLTLLGVLPSRPTNSDSVEHVRLTATGDAARQVKEGDEKAEIDFDGAVVKSSIVTIAGHTTASRQVLSDSSALQSQIDNVIRQKVLAKLEYHILNGQGGDDIEGLLSLAAPMVTTLPGVADRIGETVTSMRTLGYNPSVIVMNPADWLVLTTSKNSDGDYLFGSPTAPAPRVLWSVPVVLSAGIPAGKALVLDTSHITILDRESLSVMLSNSHKDYFTRNLVAILGELRAGLEVRDEAAVLEVTLVDGPGTGDPDPEE